MQIILFSFFRVFLSLLKILFILTLNIIIFKSNRLKIVIVYNFEKINF